LADIAWVIPVVAFGVEACGAQSFTLSNARTFP
jgi:hypothetical protein